MRRRAAEKRNYAPDRVYSSVVVSRFVNHVMESGKKATAEKIVYGAFKNVETETKKPAIEVFETALKNVAPILEVKSRRIGGASYQVPREVRGDGTGRLAVGGALNASGARGYGAGVGKGDLEGSDLRQYKLVACAQSGLVDNGRAGDPHVIGRWIRLRNCGRRHPQGQQQGKARH